MRLLLTMVLLASLWGGTGFAADETNWGLSEIFRGGK